MSARVWLSVGVCLVCIIGGALGQCILPQHPEHGRYVPHGEDCGGEERLHACDGTPGTLAPEEWLLVARCDPGYEPENTSIPILCNKGVWLTPQLPKCIIPDLMMKQTQQCLVPSPPPNTQYRMFPEECGAETLPPGTEVPQDCILFLNCAPGFNRMSGKGDYLTHCTNRTWSPSIPDDLCIVPDPTYMKQGEGSNPTSPVPLPTASLSDCVLPYSTPIRKFCSLEKDCAEHCTFHNDKCIVSSGSKVKQVKVVCDEGYTTGNANSISVCFATQFYPPLLECVSTGDNDLKQEEGDNPPSP